MDRHVLRRTQRRPCGLRRCSDLLDASAPYLYVRGFSSPPGVWSVSKSPLSDTVLPHGDQGRRDLQPAWDRPLCRSEFPVAPPADDHRRLCAQPGDDLARSAGPNGAIWSALLQGELPRESKQEYVLADVDVARRVRRSGPSTVVTVTAAVAGATVNPVRVHPSTAYSALHQPGEHVIARRSVLTPPGRTTLLHRDEAGLTDQRGMRHGPGDRPLARDRRPVSAPHLTTRVARVGQDHCHRP